MTDVPIPAEAMQDPWGVRMPGLGATHTVPPCNGRPSARRFCPAGDPSLWLPVDEGYRVVNVERQLAEPGSLLNLYRRLLAYRKTSRVLQSGDYQPVVGVPDECFIFLRRMAEAQGHPPVLVALNFSSEAVGLRLPEMGVGEVILSTQLDRTVKIDLAEFHLRGDEGLLIEVRDNL
jgi:alpha-glucosidase